MKIFKQLRPAFHLLLPLTGGILMGLTPAPVEAWPLAWIALVPLWFLVGTGLKGTAQKTMVGQTVPNPPLQRHSIRQRALYGLVWGIGFHGLALFWITGIHPMTWMGVPWLASLAIAIFCWTFITLWGAALVAIWAALLSGIGDWGFGMRKKSKILPLVRVLLGTALWCGLEALWSAGPLWWTSLSYTQSPHNLIILHLGQLSGPSTVTAAIVAVNGLIGEAWISYQSSMEQGRGGERNQSSMFPPQLSTSLQPLTLLSIAAGFLIALHLIGFTLYSRPLVQPTAAALKVGIIQGNIPNEIKLYSEGERRALEGYTTGYQTLADRGVDAVLMPEGAFPFFWSSIVQERLPFYLAVLDKGVVAWVGAFRNRGLSYSNSLFSITGTGETFSYYDKVKLVPLGEYVPFENILGGLIDRLSPLKEHQVPGAATQQFETPFGRAIAGICYESAFAEHFRRQAAAGGQFILSPSNDAHYSPAMPAQHHAQDVMRAIETDRWAVRATNTGYSAIVNPHGRAVWLSELNKYAIHADTIYRRQTQTLYVRWGDWLTKILLALVGIAWFVLKQSNAKNSDRLRD
jgi:apolipoprotein N-acyltransferase